MRAGVFSGSLPLAPGHVGRDRGADGGDPVTRRVTFQPAAGLSGTLRLEGGQSYLELEQDGAPVAGVSGSIADDGDRIDARGQRDAADPGGQRGRDAADDQRHQHRRHGAPTGRSSSGRSRARQLKGTGEPWQEIHRSTW